MNGKQHTDRYPDNLVIKLADERIAHQYGKREYQHEVEKHFYSFHVFSLSRLKPRFV